MKRTVDRLSIDPSRGRMEPETDVSEWLPRRALLDEAFEERKMRPGPIEVSHSALHALLVERLGSSGIEVAVRERLPGVDRVLASMASRFGIPSSTCCSHRGRYFA